MVEGLSLKGAGDFDVALKDIRFSVRAGEILGIAGVAGNGQNELVLALSGETPGAAAAIRLDGKPIGALADRRAAAAGARRRCPRSGTGTERCRASRWPTTRC